MKYLYFTSLYISYGLLVFAFISGFKKYLLLGNKEKWYLYYCAFLLLIEIATNTLIEVFGFKNTSFMYPIFIGGEFFILITLYIKKLSLSDWWLLPTAILTAGLLIINQCITLTNDYIKVISNIIIICFAGYTLLQEIKNEKKANHFLSVDAFIFMYYTVSVFIFVLQNQLTSLSENTYFIILSTNNMLLIVFYASLLYTFLRLKKNLLTKT